MREGAGLTKERFCLTAGLPVHEPPASAWAGNRHFKPVECLALHR